MNMAYVVPPAGPLAHQQQQQQQQQQPQQQQQQHQHQQHHHHHHHHHLQTYHPYVDGSAQLAQQQQQHHHHQYGVPANPSMPPMTCDLKPRLTKEQHDILESHFQKQNKPSTNTKKCFAETLNVSLDKVNNWFQNRRAKSKQDAKKQAGAYNLYAQQCQQQHQRQPDHHSSAFNNSDSDTSPSFASPEYFTMMQQQHTSDAHVPTTMAYPQSHFPASDIPTSLPNGMPYAAVSAPEQHFAHGLMPPPSMPHDMFDSPQEMNRRTLTQEQFDAFSHHGAMAHPSAPYSGLPEEYSAGAEGLVDNVYMSHEDFKNDDLSFSTHMAVPLSSEDSSGPSSLSEQAMFPSSSILQDHGAFSETSSDLAESRSSSVSGAAHSGSDSPFLPLPAPPSTSSGQWQPGQSVPVDPTDLQQQFQEAQRQAAQQSAQPEQALPWPVDDALVRRDSQTGMVLAQQMSSFAIQTPQPAQTATFKSPPPPPNNGGSIAARRQRPRPAALGLASLRSQSYSGAVQPASPGQSSQNLAPSQQLRRIRSSNVINGVAQGRVMKSTPGSAQRSPMSWTFADAMHANQRHAQVSVSGNLAPPTPLSPSARQEQSRGQFPPWQSSGNFSRQTSISEHDAETGGFGDAMTHPPAFTSPPQTPMFHHHHQQQMAHRIGNTVITENTPPQSAPAVQTSFPATAFMPPPPPPPPVSQYPSNQQSFAQAQPQQFMNVSVPEQQMQIPAPQYAPAQQFIVPTSEAPQLQMSFANGVPIVNAQGQLTMAYPPQVQQMPFAPQSTGMAPQPAQQFSFVTNSCPPPGIHVTSQLPRLAQPAAEFFVHEYSPPSDVKGSAAPRKAAVDNGPKNYTFVLVDSDKAKRNEGKAGTPSSSPASASS